MRKGAKTIHFDNTELLNVVMKDNKFISLWFGNWESNSDSFNTNYSTQSEADLALCYKLAFYWEKDFKAVGQMFQRRGLYHKKWDELRCKNKIIEKPLKAQYLLIKTDSERITQTGHPATRKFA